MNIIVDSSHSNYEHEMVNSAILLAFIHSKEPTKIYAGALPFEVWSSIIQIYDKAASGNIIFKPIPIFKGGGKLKLLIAAFFDIKAFISARSAAATVYVTLNPFSAHLIDLLSNLTNRNTYTFCHSDMEFLAIPRRFRCDFTHRIINHLFKNHNISSFSHYIVLGENIRKNITKSIPGKNRERIHSIEHPYFPTVSSPIEKTENQDQRTKIGMISSVGRNNGFQNLQSFMKRLVDKAHSTAFTFHLIGRHPKPLSVIGDNIIDENPDGKMMPKASYGKLVQMLDYAYFPYNQDSYRFTASGAVCEALTQGKPIIALKNDYFQHLFTLHGPMGYLYESELQFEAILSEIKQQSAQLQDVFSANLAHFTTAVDPLNFSHEFSKLREKLSLRNMRRQ